MIAKQQATYRQRNRPLTTSGFLAVVVVMGIAFHPARAQQPVTPVWQPTTTQPAPAQVGQPAGLPVTAPPPWQGVQVLVTPYFWLPWISSTVRPSDTRIPSASTTVDPGGLISHLEWIPFMGAAEFREGPFGLALDFIHLPVKAGANTRGILFAGATGKLTEDEGTAMFLYRPMVQPDQYLDVGLGVRAWGVDGDIALNQGMLLPAVNVSHGFSWADPLIGVRYHRDIGNGFALTAYGDVGGFGAGAHIDWQLLGTIDYAVNSWTDVRGGFRSLNFSFGGDRANFKQNIYGPILAATFRF